MTLRELAWMARGRARGDWDRTSLLCAVLVNSNPFREGEAVPPSTFNPYAQGRPPEPAPTPALPLSALKKSFIRDGWV